MSDLFGRYQSQQSRSLARIDSTKYPDTNKDFESNLRRLNGFVDYISQYLQQMQKGVDQATQGPLTNARDILMNVGSLLGGGALLNDIDLGDLQYYLPAIGALFGFNNGQPFPINLFYAAEHFLLGYIVPLDSFAFVIEDLIAGWAEAFGLSPEFMESINELLEAIQSVTTDVVGLLQVLMDLLGVFGIDTTGEGLGVFGDIWHAISKLLGGLDLKIIGELSDPILDALAPWISTIAQAIGQLDQLIKAFSGGVSDLQGVLNFTSMFTDVIDFLAPDFNKEDSWNTIIGEFFGEILNPVNWGELFTELTGGIAGSNPLTDLGNFLKDQLQWQINPNRLGAIPIGAITAAAPNMVADLISAASLEGESQWLFDADVEPAGAVGSARTTFDGTLHELISERILIDVGRRIEASVKIKYSGVTASTGSPIRLSWIGWNGDAEVAGGDFAVHQPSGPALDWTTLSGLITRQDGDTWDRLSIRLTVTPGATAGTVWFASPRATKPDKLPQSFVDGLADALAAAGQTIRDAICNALGFPGTGHTDADVIHALTNIPQAAVEGIDRLVNQVKDGFAAWWNTWFGRTDGTGSVAQIQQTAQAIKVAIQGGYTLQTFPTNTTWTLPPGVILTDVTGVVINPGQCGTYGGDSYIGSSAGGVGGRGGSYSAKKLDLTGLTPGVSTLAIEVGPAGNTSGAVGGTSRIKSGTTVLLEGVAGTGGVAAVDGWMATMSTAGDGGDGGATLFTGGSPPSVSVTQPADGRSSAVGVGGTRGVSSVNNNPGTTVGGPGAAGGPGSATTVPLCGGGGGGGGGAAGSTTSFNQVYSGAGGNGGYPGGAGGGSGGLTHSGNRGGMGSFGLGAHGLVALIYKTT